MSAPSDLPRDAQAAGWDERVEADYDDAQLTAEALAKLQAEGQLENTWAGSAVKYEWQEEFGDVGPEIPQLEAQLFKDENKLTIGEYIQTLREFKVELQGPVHIKPISKFEDAGLHPVTLDNVNKCNYLFPTPIQAYTIPAVLSGHDVIGVAQTGSGKTAAYMVPILSKLMGKAKKIAAPRPNPVTYDARRDAIQAQPLVLIMVPTRELALQIFDEARRMCYRTMLRPCVAYGGGPRREQLDDLKKGCDILIGTAGRLMDYVTTEARWLSLNRLKYTVIDEADEMVQSGWEDELDPILSGGASQTNADHTFLFFSATFPAESRKLAKKYLADDHIRIRVGRIGSAHSNINQVAVYATEENKSQCLYDLLLSLPACRTVIFVNSRKRVDIIDDFLYNKNFPVTSIHSERTQRERENAIRAFKDGKCPILVASGVTARGLDIKNVMHVINYDLPSTEHGGIDEYVHRIGRTGRIGNRGQATSFFNDDNLDLAEALAKTFLENKQELPDFLQEHAPADGVVEWEDKSDDGSDAEAGGAGVEAGWAAAAGEDQGNGVSQDAGASWGGEQVTTPAAETAWGGSNEGGAALGASAWASDSGAAKGGSW